MTIEEVGVLIVDDDRDTCDTLKMLLDLDGYTTWIAADGRAALALVEQVHPLCVLIDLNMPGMTGAELTRSIRLAKGDDVVLVAITGSRDSDALNAAEEAGIDHILTKPVDVAQLQRILPRLV
ncbi:MAG: response regulator [Ideonella sp.]